MTYRDWLGAGARLAYVYNCTTVHCTVVSLECVLNLLTRVLVLDLLVQGELDQVPPEPQGPRRGDQGGENPPGDRSVS